MVLDLSYCARDYLTGIVEKAKKNEAESLYANMQKREKEICILEEKRIKKENVENVEIKNMRLNAKFMSRQEEEDKHRMFIQNMRGGDDYLPVLEEKTYAENISQTISTAWRRRTMETGGFKRM